MKVSCKNCGRAQDYYPRITNGKLSKTTSTKCKSCGNIIRASKKKIKLITLEIREQYIIFQTDINKIKDNEVLINFWNIKNFDLLNYGIVQAKMRQFSIFLEKFTVNDREIIYGEIKINMFKKLSHIEIYDEKINFLFRKPLPDENLIEHLEECKILSIQIQENLINCINIPSLIQPLDIGYYNLV
jgi:hypothetical protein